MNNWDSGHMDDGWGILMMLGMVTIWALIAVAIVWLIRSARESAAPSAGTLTASAPVAPERGSAGQILADRLARGDIDPEEYKSRLDALRSGSGS